MMSTKKYRMQTWTTDEQQAKDSTPGEVSRGRAACVQTDPMRSILLMSAFDRSILGGRSWSAATTSYR